MQRELRRQVKDRANGLCEYCRVRPTYFQVDHIISTKYEGEPDLDNPACACILCNQYKGPVVAAFANDGIPVRLFNPRKQRREDHFRLNGTVIEPLTPEGEATIQTLRLNDEARVKERLEFQSAGMYPRSSDSD